MVEVIRLNVALLDDYHGLSERHFGKLDRSLFNLTVFKDTLLPYNHPETPESVKDALVTRLEPFHVICTMRERTPFPEELIARLPNLRMVLTTGLRNKSLDLPAFEKRNIPVAGTADKQPAGGSSTSSTTEHCVALVLALARNVASADLAVKSGLWQTELALGLAGKTFAVVGLGRLGTATAKIMRQSFGMNIIAWSPNLTQEAADTAAADAGLPVCAAADGERTFRVVDRHELFAAADVLSLHIVLSERTRGLVTADDLSRMKASALLVNTSRGPLIVQQDLLQLLKKGHIRGCALDVFDLEPLPLNSEWRTVPWGREGRSRVLLTPHMGYAEEDVLNGWYAQQVDNLTRWQSGDDLLNRLT